jgi:hypothetical protein
MQEAISLIQANGQAVTAFLESANTSVADMRGQVTPRFLVHFRDCNAHSTMHIRAATPEDAELRFLRIYPGAVVEQIENKPSTRVPTRVPEEAA